MLEQKLDSIIYRITSPVVVVNHGGEKLLANEAGEKLFDRLLFIYEPLGQGPISITEQLRLLSQSVCPVYLACEDLLVKITPLDAVRFPDRAALIEWLPLPGEEQLRILQEVSQAVNSSLIMEDIFEALGEVLHYYIPYREATIVILDDTQNGIKIMVRMFEGGAIDIQGDNNLFAGYDAVVDRMIRNPSPQMYGAGQWGESIVIPEGAASAIVVPLINKGVVIGAVAVSTGEEGGFQYYQQELLAQVSEQLAVAVENAKFYWKTQAQASREFLLNQLTKAIRQSLEIDVILETAVRELGKVMGVSRCFIQYFPDGPDTPDNSAEAVQTFYYALPGIQPLVSDNAHDRPFEYRVFESRKKTNRETLQREHIMNPFILNDTRDCPPLLAGQEYFESNALQSLAILPILVGDVLVGTMTLHQCDFHRVWVLEDIELLKAMAEHMGVGLHQAQLFSELARQKETLEATLEELQQAQIHLVQSEKMAVLGQFVAGIAHEVNTPLGTMISNHATIKRCLEKLGDHSKESPKNSAQLVETMAELLDINKLASDRIQEIVKNLRNFSRLDESELKTVDLHENIDSTLLLIKSSLKKHIELVRDFQPKLPQVECFPGLLNQVFMNLIVNASHALDEKEKGSITIRTQFIPNEKRVDVSVIDTGKGIPPENIKKIFDPGFTTKGVGVGTGLGLALCYKIVEKHQGRIIVDSTVGEGTTFTVQVPVKQSKN